MNYVRMVVWPRGQQTEQGPSGPYRYILVGMVLSEKPIPAWEKKSADGISEQVIDGPVLELLSLEEAPTRDPKRRLGDAMSVLHSLDDI